jgi:hypothetical protein
MTLGFGRLEDKVDWCKYMEQCGPNDNEIEDYCCENYKECKKYIQREKIKLKFSGI